VIFLLLPAGAAHPLLLSALVNRFFFAVSHHYKVVLLLPIGQLLNRRRRRSLVPVERRVLLTERRRSASFGTREQDAEMSTAIIQDNFSLIRPRTNPDANFRHISSTYARMYVRREM
jgi:hypothetical protein